MTDVEARAVFGSFADVLTAESAVSRLLEAGIPKQHVSVLGGGEAARQHILGSWDLRAAHYRGMEKEGEKQGTVVGGILGLLEGAALFFIPGVGEIAILGPLAGLLIGGAVGWLAGWLSGEWATEDHATTFRERLKEGRYLVVAMVPADQEDSVRSILSACGGLELDSVRTSNQAIEALTDESKASMR